MKWNYLVIVVLGILSRTGEAGIREDYNYARNVLGTKSSEVVNMAEFVVTSKLIVEDFRKTFSDESFGGHVPTMFNKTYEKCGKFKDELEAFKINQDQVVIDSFETLEAEISKLRSLGARLVSRQKGTFSSVLTTLIYLDGLERTYNLYKEDISKFTVRLPGTPAVQKVAIMTSALDNHIGAINKMQNILRKFSSDSSQIIEFMIWAQEKLLIKEYEDITRTKLKDLGDLIQSTFTISALLREAGATSATFLVDRDRKRAVNTGDFVAHRKILFSYKAIFETYQTRLNGIVGGTDIQKGILRGHIDPPLDLINRKLENIESKAYSDYLNDHVETIKLMIEYDLSPSEKCTRLFNSYLKAAPTIGDVDSYLSILTNYKQLYFACISGGV